MERIFPENRHRWEKSKDGIDSMVTEVTFRRVTDVLMDCINGDCVVFSFIASFPDVIASLFYLLRRFLP